MRLLILVAVLLFPVSVFSLSCECLDKLVSKSPIIVFADLDSSDTRVGNWNSISLDFLRATYSIEKVVKGKIDEKSFEVVFPIVKGYSWIDDLMPKLSSKLFEGKKRYILFLKKSLLPEIVIGIESELKQNKKLLYDPTDEKCGLIRYEKEFEDSITKLLTAKS
jgi:hypothetical protein